MSSRQYARFTLKVRKPTDPAERHQLRIARDTMKMHCIGARIMGGPNHYEAASIIHQLTGVIVGIDADCTCYNAQAEARIRELGVRS